MKKHHWVVVSLLIIGSITSAFVGCSNEPTNIIISFDAQGGTEANPATKLVSYKSTYGSLGMTTREGYRFDGWWSGEGGTGTQVTTVSTVTTESNHTLYAKWAADDHTLRFDANEGTGSMAVVSLDTDDVTTLPANTLTRDGYIFAGWATTSGGTVIYANEASFTMGSSDVTLYAKWSAIYTVSFDSQVGSTPAPEEMTVTDGFPYGTLATTSRPGYDFSGWWTGANGTGIQITETSNVDIGANLTLYAAWTAATFKVTFDAQYGTDSDPLTKDVTYAQPYGELATTTRNGHTFSGWWTGEDGTGSEVTESTVFTETADCTLYAKWTFDVITGPAGGLVFYENPNYITDGWRYLEAAPYGWYQGGNDPGFQWGVYDYKIDPTAVATGIGSGAINTVNIVNYHDTLKERHKDKGDYYTNPTAYHKNNDGTVAAKVCAEHSSEHEGNIYDDWFLPSKDELNQMRQNLYVHRPEGFSEFYYWSSSEIVHPNYASYAWYQRFGNGDQKYYDRTYSYRVRPIRAF